MSEIAWESIVDDLRASNPEITDSLDYLIKQIPESWGLAKLCPYDQTLDMFWEMSGVIVLMEIAPQGVTWTVIGSDGLLGESQDPVTAQEAHVAIQGILDAQVG